MQLQPNTSQYVAVDASAWQGNNNDRHHENEQKQLHHDDNGGDDLLPPPFITPEQLSHLTGLALPLASYVHDFCVPSLAEYVYFHIYLPSDGDVDGHTSEALPAWKRHRYGACERN